MNPPTLTIRVPLYPDVGEKPLDIRINEECDMRWNLNYRLAGMLVVGSDAVLVFQLQLSAYA
jgi:hypothetical protein